MHAVMHNTDTHPYANNRKKSLHSRLWSKVHLFYEQKILFYFVFVSIVKMLNLWRDYLLRQSCCRCCHRIYVCLFGAHICERRYSYIPVFRLCRLPSMRRGEACVVQTMYDWVVDKWQRVPLQPSDRHRHHRHHWRRRRRRRRWQIRWKKHCEREYMESNVCCVRNGRISESKNVGDAGEMK